jgi:hypothetical protein
LEAALWGLLGSGSAEALNLSAAMRPVGPDHRWRRPWANRDDRAMVLIAIGLRLFAGFALTAAMAASEQLPKPLTAFVAGLAAPLLVARMFQAVPVHEPTPGELDRPGRSDAAR